MKIFHKLLASFLVIALMMVVLGASALVYFNRMSAMDEEIMENQQLATFLSQKEVDHLLWMEQVTRIFAEGTLPEHLSNYDECSFGKWYYSFKPQDYNQEVYQALEKPHQQLHETGKKIAELYKSGNVAEAERLFKTEMVPTVTAVRDGIHAFQAVQAQRITDLTTQMNAADKRIRFIFMALVAVTVLIALILAFFLNQAIVKPLKNMVDKAEQVAKGDLTIEIGQHGKDEIGVLGAAFDHMVKNLKELIHQINGRTSELMSFVESIKVSSLETAKSAEQIAATVQEIAEGSSLMAEDSEKLKMLSDQLKEISQETQRRYESTLEKSNLTVDSARQGNEALQAAIHELDKIAKTVEFATTSIQNLGKRSQQIGDIVNIIHDIASQTNLLSLNAAIEAARAGEHGRGFAVVAQEVKKLADGAGKSALKINSLIEDITSETNVSVKSMEFNEEEIKRQLANIKKAGTALERIVGFAEMTGEEMESLGKVSQNLLLQSAQLDDMVNSFSAISEENAAGTEEVAAATQEQTATMEEVASSVEILEGSAVSLKEAVNRFKV